jgi:predicted  nucleic acid-binding Zn ribbon protein
MGMVRKNDSDKSKQSQQNNFKAPAILESESTERLSEMTCPRCHRNRTLEVNLTDGYVKCRRCTWEARI